AQICPAQRRPRCHGFLISEAWRAYAGFARRPAEATASSSAKHGVRTLALHAGPRRPRLAVNPGYCSCAAIRPDPCPAPRARRPRLPLGAGRCCLLLLRLGRLRLAGRSRPGSSNRLRASRLLLLARALRALRRPLPLPLPRVGATAPALVPATAAPAPPAALLL